MRLVLATANRDKAREVREILEAAADSITVVPRPEGLPDVEETGETLEDNARLKAEALVVATGLPAVADDTGLEVEALGGAPGVRSARYAGEAASYADNVAKLLRELQGVASGARRARFVTVALLRWPGGRELVRRGVVEGRIADEARGTRGFGYDPVFVPDEGDGRTFAEMPAADKHEVSHRGRAFRSLAEALAERPADTRPESSTEEP